MRLVTWLVLRRVPWGVMAVSITEVQMQGRQLRAEVARLQAEARRQTFWMKVAAALLAAILVVQLVSL